MSSYDIFVNSDWKNQIFFYQSHDNYFFEKSKNQNQLLPESYSKKSYSKSYSESYSKKVIMSNFYNETGIFQIFPYSNNDDVIKNMAPFLIFL